MIVMFNFALRMCKDFLIVLKTLGEDWNFLQYFGFSGAQSTQVMKIFGFHVAGRWGHQT
jgi:hypothetical protein